MEPVVPSIIEEMEQYKPIPYATTWQRFANYLIDSVIYYLLLMAVIFVLAVLTELYQVDLVGVFISEEPGDKLLSYLYSYLLFFVIYLLFEGLTKGRTIGKLVTGTRAVKEDNTPITWKDAVRRSLIRLVPFEAFTAFNGAPWHDTKSKTTVVKTRGI